MRAFCLCLVLSSLTACQVTRTVAGQVSPQLRTAGHSQGFAVSTTSIWRQRMDPAATVRFRASDGRWGDWLSAFDLRVDEHGAWVKRTVSNGELADEIRITGLAEDLSDTIEKTRPLVATVTRDGGTWILTGPRSEMVTWAHALELAIAHRVRGEQPCATIDVCTRSQQDSSALYHLRVTRRGDPLGTWQLVSKEQGRSAPVTGHRIDKLLNDQHETLVGYDWNAITDVQIKNVSGPRTLAAVLGTSAVAVVFLPVALVLRAGSTSSGSGSSGSSGASGAGRPLSGGGELGLTRTKGEWEPRLASHASLDARPLFTTGARVRSIIRVTAAVDATAATNADFFASGVIARVRIMEMLEIGGGVRQSFTHIDSTTRRSTSAVFQLGLHLPLDASGHVAFAFGVENGSGGAIARDVRLPWGPRFQSGRWLVSLQPATPSYLRMNNVDKGRWSFNIGGEVGLSF